MELLFTRGIYYREATQKEALYMPFRRTSSNRQRPPGPPSGGPNTGSNNPPSGPPPNFIPSEAQATKVGGQASGGVSTFAIDGGAIFPCRFRYTYIWLNNGRSFWSYIVFVGRDSIAGWRYTGRRWVYFGIDLRRIRSFYCR